MLVSYAQNNEDVLLNRCFASQDTGFYVDVGAWHPLNDSVTKMFYDRGWHGINIEPTDENFALLQAERPRDINLNCLVGKEAGSATFHAIKGTGLSTTGTNIAAQHGARGFEVQDQLCSVRTLQGILQQHASDRIIDFLKIDVEGMEEDVIRGMDWQQFRPRVLVIEATKPSTQILSVEAWEHLILAANYLDAYFDGLNKFYVRGEEPALLEYFKTPVNIFDNSVPYRFLKNPDTQGA